MKMPQPIALDVLNIPWKIPKKIVNSLQGIVSINMIHVEKWADTIALFRESGKLLNKWQFLNCLVHLKLVIGTQVKVIIFLIMHQR